MNGDATMTLELLARPGDAEAPVIYVVDSPEHPLDLVPVASGRASAVVRAPVREWGARLTPWPAPGLRAGDPDFAGGAAQTLSELLATTTVFEAREGLRPARRAICGYSLAGLFALYAFVSCGAFDACASVSGSVWYPGWVDYLRAAAFDGAGRLAFLSVGKKERRAGPAVFRHVEEDLAACADALRAHGCAVETSLGPGSHVQHQRERMDLALTILDGFLAGR